MYDIAKKALCQLLCYYGAINMENERDELFQILLKQSVFFDDFVLSSGEKSNFYIDARKTTLHPVGVNLVAKIFLNEFLKDKEVNAVGGPTLGADPIVGAMLSLSERTDIHGFIVRKEIKKHGTQKLIEGNLEKGDRVVVVEDVITTGGSVLRAVDLIRKSGAHVSKVMTIVNRTKCEKLFEKEGIDFFSIFNAEDLIDSKKKKTLQRNE